MGGNKCCKGTCKLDFETMNIRNTRPLPKCRQCAVTYLNWEGMWCPCCGQRLSRRICNSVKNNANKVRIEAQ